MPGELSPEIDWQYRIAIEVPGGSGRAGWFDARGATITTQRAAAMNSIPTCTRSVIVGLESGLHLTPSSQIVQLAQKFSAEFLIRKGDKAADGKSMLDLMQLAAEHGETLQLEARGDDAAEAVLAIAQLFERNFNLDQPD